MKSHLRNLFIILSITLLGIGTIQAQQKDVKATFEGYKSAILNDRGTEALSYLDSRTLKYYGDLAQKIRTADSMTLESFSVIDKITILMIRATATKEELLSFDGNSLLVYAFNKGMVGKNSITNNSIGAITINKGFAKAGILTNGKKTPLYFHFYKEQNSWKIDITSLFPFTEDALKKVISDSGKSENEFVLYLLELVAHKKLGTEVWQPVTE